VRGSHRHCEQELGDEIAIPNGVNAVLRHGAKTKTALEQNPGDWKRTASGSHPSQGAIPPHHVKPMQFVLDPARAARNCDNIQCAAATGWAR